ncbi:Retrovirus-related Pol polyprotein from transposon TNT 1-94 [Vitis vinifera]|uniref:Retrovirus-related Pol polyprotein from transposon TNT 1-94 n=1 Tax=Vitis vinifera TaxID=29760 RepID=A0A438KE01_VITVI|nr:Retrovirus-related Pol polyprotein from transposon TNT 1-94 [Vitis vinifera]
MCGNCKQLGHVTKVCKYKNKGPQSQQAQVADADSQEEKLFVASCFSSQDSYNAWLIDSGCTHHMCHNATIFKDLDKTYNSTVKVGNGGYVDVKGRGTIAIKTNSGIKLIFDVLFVPDISQNLLSVGQMLEKQYSLQFKHNQCIIFDPYGEKFLCVKMKSKNFAINWENAVEYAYAGVTQSVLDLWNIRLEHYNQRSLVEQKKLELVEDMRNVSNEAQICVICQQGKQARLLTKSLKNKAPYEAWYGVQPSVKHLKIFGRICYYHVPEPKRSKLDSRAQKSILIGYGTSTKGYRIFCLQTNKVVLSRNVKFDEMITWVWQSKKDAQSDVDFDNHEDFKLLNP